MLGYWQYTKKVYVKMSQKKIKPNIVISRSRLINENERQRDKQEKMFITSNAKRINEEGIIRKILWYHHR